MINKEFGAGLVYSEMISAKGLLYENDKTWELTQTDSGEHPISIQLFGGDIDSIVKAAMMIDEKTDADIIDLNMGCPVRKVLNAESGCMLLQNPEKVYEMVSQVVKHVKKPVSVKIRAGWDHSHINCAENAIAIEKAGASLIAIHGRTKSDLYTGKVNLDYIRMVKEKVSIPVIGNGDIRCIDDAVRMIDETHVDMIMVGRGSFGNPWLIRDLTDYFSGRPLKPAPTFAERIDMCRRHFTELLAIKEERSALLEMRHLASWYMKGMRNTKEFRQKLITAGSGRELFLLFDEMEMMQKNTVSN
jgi:nifR3 family TIM-barrel protein